MRTVSHWALLAACGLALVSLPSSRGESEYTKSIDTSNPFLPDFHNSKTRTDLEGYRTSRMEILIDDRLNVVPSMSSSSSEDTEQFAIPNSLNHQNSAFQDQPDVGILGKFPKELLRKTGTTIAGIAGKDFCVLAADTRATMGMTVADKRAEKLHKLTHSCWAAGAGTSADLQHISRICHHTFHLLQLQQEYTIGNAPQNSNDASNLQKPYPSIPAICNWLREDLYKKQGSCQANLIVGGICPKTNRPYLRAIHPHGSMDRVAFTALGSGGMAAMAVLESSLSTSSFNQNEILTDVNTAIEVVLRAVRSGIENDLGSGSQIDLVVMYSNGKTEYRRAAEVEEEFSSTDTNVDIPNTKSGGVNGFGKIPFELKPSTIGQTRIPKTKKEVEAEWDDFLGL